MHIDSWEHFLRKEDKRARFAAEVVVLLEELHSLLVVLTSAHDEHLALLGFIRDLDESSTWGLDCVRFQLMCEKLNLEESFNEDLVDWFTGR